MTCPDRHPAFPRHRPAFIIGDAMLALALAMLLFMALAALVSHQRKAERQLGATRAAVRDTESALLELQAGGTRAPDLRLERLPAAAPEGQAWVRATLHREQGPERSLVGLVPLKALDVAPTPSSTPAASSGGTSP
jgi:hypothetical protein